MKAIFTPGDIAVAEQLLRAKQNPEIAEALGSTENAIKMQMQRMWLKSPCWLRPGQFRAELNRILLALWIHENRHALGVRCIHCGELVEPRISRVPMETMETMVSMAAD